MSPPAAALMTVEYGYSNRLHAQAGLKTAEARAWVQPPGLYYLNSLSEIAVFLIVAGWVLARGGSGVGLVLGCFLLGYAGKLMIGWRPYRRWLQRSYLPDTLDAKEKRVLLEIGPLGMTECIGEVSCFAPWSAVVKTVLIEDFLSIELSSGQCAVIPRQSSAGTVDLEAVRAEIERRRNALVSTEGATASQPGATPQEPSPRTHEG